MVAGMKSFIFIYGPPGVGKSTCGKLLAQDLGMPFIDLDQKIEEKAGIDIPSIFKRDGEAGFRLLESSTLAEIIDQPTAVVSLGGGALLDPSNRELAEQNGRVICLNASHQYLTKRLGANKNRRPLLKYDNLVKLLQKRQSHYDSFPLAIHTDGLSLQECVQTILLLIGIYRISGMGSEYTVHIGFDILQNLAGLLSTANLQEPLALVSDSNVAHHYSQSIIDILNANGIKASHITFPAGENNKTLDTVTSIWHELLEMQMDRRGTVIALGGGVANDMVGFAAATFMRGVSWVSLPTSLLAMVDASIGGKTGVNLPNGKNLIGAFYPPALVLADTETLSTLPKEEIISGMAEVVKHAIIDDADLFEQCSAGIPQSTEQWTLLVKRAAAVKINIIQKDPFEQGRRAALNLGHTIGHAIEKNSNFSIRHGEAVAIGLVAEARLAEHISLASPGLAEQISIVLSEIGLPTSIPDNIDRKQILHTMQYDKKRRGSNILFALPAAIGDVRTGIEIDDLSQLLSEL